MSAAVVGADGIDVKGVRESIGLSQEEFALWFGLDLDSLQNWETGRRAMPKAVRSYLRVIERMPEQTSRALEASVSQPDRG